MTMKTFSCFAYQMRRCTGGEAKGQRGGTNETLLDISSI